MSERLDVIVNDRVLLLPLTGVGHYVRQLLAALRSEADIRAHPFLTGVLGIRARRDTHAASPARAVRPGLRQRLRRSSAVRSVLQASYAVAFRRGARGYQLYHEPNHIPIRCDRPTVTTIHDLSVLEHPEWHPADRVRWYERGFAAGLRQTSRFIAPSEFTRQEMAARLGLAEDRIDVTYQAPRPGFAPAGSDRVRQACEALRLPERFFLYVGTLEPRKNVSGLLAAYARLPAEVRQAQPLVLAGGFGWKMEALEREINGHGLAADVRMTGYLSDEFLLGLYGAATALVWPTFYEGFGLPPLEAMACGCPVITSAVTSLPEVVGDAGVLLDPCDTPAWAEAMRRAVEDPGWRTDLCARGLARAATFTWARCARQTIACYRAALGMPQIGQTAGAP
ncbi:MAG: glycosyltransferase family 1 protein [Planctomycetota bacterium]